MKTFTLIIGILLFTLICVIRGFSQTSANDVSHVSTYNQNLKAPVKLAIDASDNIYVTDDFQKSVLKYDASGNFIDTIHVGVAPLSIAINGSGQLFVGDGETGKIYKVESNGTMTEFYTGCFFPNAMTFSPEGILYVADGKLQKVIALDVSANVIQTIGLGTLLFPSEVVYDKRNSRILVSEHGGVGPGVGMSNLPVCKIWVFNLAGALQGSFASAGNTNGKFYRIQGMAVGKCGNLYVCDPFQGNISVFSENNVFLTRFGQFGTQPGDLNVPIDILFDSQERIIVASMNNGALEVYHVNDSLPTSNIANSDAVICSGQSANITIDFTGSSPWTFTYTVDGLNPVSITTSDNPYILNTTQGGVYEITALSDINKTGTCFSGSAKITVNSAIPTTNMTTGNVAVCTGSSINIPVQFTGTSPWTFTYTKDGLNPVTVTTANNPYIINTSDAGLYEVTSVSAGGCQGNTFIGNANISQYPLPASVISAGSMSSICQGQTATIPISFTGTAPYTFTYTIDNQNPATASTSDNNYLLTVTQPGKYQISSMSDVHCNSIDNQGSADLNFIPIPTISMANLNLTNCAGSLFEIPVNITGMAPYTFSYTINDTIIQTVSTNDNQFTLSVADPGIYHVITIDGNGCAGTSITGTSTVNTTPLPTSVFADGNNQIPLCEGQSANMLINFTGTAPWTFTYTINDIHPSTITTTDNPYILNSVIEGIYEVQSIADANCINYSTLGTPEVLVTPLPSAEMTSSVAYICNGNAVNIPVAFSGISPWTFTYTVDGINPLQVITSDNPYSLVAANAGLYQITDIATNNCAGNSITGSTTVEAGLLAHPSFTYNVNGQEVTFTNNSLNANSYLWDFGDGQSSTLTNPVHQYISPAVYSVILTASNGICADSSLMQIIDVVTSVNNNFSTENISIFPNPSNGYLTINISGNLSAPWSLNITNTLGQEVFFGTYDNPVEHIDLNLLPSGIYSLRIISDEISGNGNVVIVK